MQTTIRELCQATADLDPPIKPRLRAPADEGQIRAAEEALGLAFPAELKHFLLCHNGQDFYSSKSGYADPLIPMIRQPANGQRYSHYWLGGANDIVEYTLGYRDEGEWLREQRFETFGPARYHNQFIVFTGTENADCLVLDLLPEPGGVVGQVVLLCTQPLQLVVLAPGLEQFLHALAADFRKGRFRHDPCDCFVSYVEP